MKVLLASKALVVGAYQRKLEELAQFPDVELVAVVPPAWRDGAYSQHLERAHTSGYELVVSPLAVNGNFHLFFFPELPRLLEEHRPDVLHFDEEPYNLATFLATWHASHRAIPTLFFTWQNLLRQYPLPFRMIERYVYRQASWAIAGTEAALNVLRTKGYGGPASVIPQFGVDPEAFRPRVDPKPTGPFMVGFAGRLVPEKGVDILLHACAQLQCDWRLLVVGDGPARRELEERISRLGIHQRVELVGPTASDRMPEVLRGLDVLVLPSVSRPNWTEQFGRILVEAMACGVPVVGSSSGEIPEVVGQAGLIFPEGDVSALAQLLERLAGDVSARAELAILGRHRALERYTHQAVAAATVDIYRQLATLPDAQGARVASRA